MIVAITIHLNIGLIIYTILLYRLSQEKVNASLNCQKGDESVMKELLEGLTFAVCFFSFQIHHHNFIKNQFNKTNNNYILIVYKTFDNVR